MLFRSIHILMVFPESSRVRFTRNPLQKVVWQLQFPKILSILAKAPADFQDRIRGRYPIYDSAPVSGPPPALASVLEQANIPFESGITHRFRTQDSTVLISLTDAFIAVSTDDYREWSEFKEHIDTAFAALVAVYEPAFFNRVGLRYINLIKRKELELDDIPWRELIKAEWVGPFTSEDLNGSITEFRASTVVKLGDEELGAAKIQFGLEDSDTFRIDSDFFLEGQINEEDATSILDDFNRAIGNLFRSAIQRRLSDALGPRQPD